MVETVSAGLVINFMINSSNSTIAAIACVIKAVLGYTELIGTTNVHVCGRNPKLE